jgi:hypothetical protein
MEVGAGSVPTSSSTQTLQVQELSSALDEIHITKKRSLWL